MNICKYLILPILVYLTSGCGGAGAPSQSGGGSTGAKEDATVVSLQVTPAVVSTPVGLTQQFVAQLNMSDGSVIDVTRDANVTWSSSNPDIATIDPHGKALGVNVGAVTIVATGSHNDTPFSGQGRCCPNQRASHDFPSSWLPLHSRLSD
ncbi:Ig-like domain-containing protein, partial [Aeromonas sp. 603696]|uniref:Ig-like domain-containing protein n=1 Tax=Aeromonas sp. 603696 TaxID=2712049 RepID=UPI003BA19451